MSILLENVNDDLYEFLERYELCEKFQDNCDIENEDNDVQPTYSDIVTSFVWAETVEGNDYWRNISSMYESEQLGIL
jgi:hypothetical protein